jgi:ABC-type polar amino acid transport system ATPase subunit
LATGVTLIVRDLTVKRGDRVVVDRMSFAAERGELVALMGVSGTGKTTVLRAIGGLDPIAAGAIEVQKPVGLVFQFHHLFTNLTVRENVWLAPVHVLRQPRADAERRAHELLDMLGVGERADAMPHELSGGEAQRVAIARALAMEPAVLLMDEPTASLDQARRGELASTLRELASAGRTVVVATHDAEFARMCARRIMVIDGGRVVREGSPSDVL